MLLDLLRIVVPNGKESIPRSHYEASKLVKALGFEYEKIHACPNDCILYRKDHADLSECPKCGVSRWRQKKRPAVSVRPDSVDVDKIPAKILRYFPLTKRLQRFYMTKDMSKNMRWHSECRTDDGKLKHPADAEAWKHLDRIFLTFALDARNVRLGLASDGFNPFGLSSTGWSTWPVLLMPYNLPPWLCMKQPYMILSTLIPGKYSPGNDIDVYLEPLIDELTHLWREGAATYDAATKDSFVMRAAVLWTINDFPAYGNLSGWSTKSQCACPVCGPNFDGVRLPVSRKFCYWNNRRWLPKDHPFRRLKTSFDSAFKTHEPPKQQTGVEIYDELYEHTNIVFGKKRFQ